MQAVHLTAAPLFVHSAILKFAVVLQNGRATKCVQAVHLTVAPLFVCSATLRSVKQELAVLRSQLRGVADKMCTLRNTWEVGHSGSPL